MSLDDSLRMVDRGLSGFHGAHRSKGAFGEFLEKVKNRQVPQDSILLVENIDRLGREPVLTAMETLIALLKHGITIQTLSPYDTFTTQSVNDGGFWRLVAHIQRAYEESKRKSDLAKANWRHKRKLAEQEGHKLTARCPAWLGFDKGEFVPIPEANKTINLIFKLKSDGFGKQSIERKLNQDAPWKLKNGWRASYIQKILNSRAVIGEYQPHTIKDGKRVALGEPISNYFPAIVQPKIFHAVRQQARSNKGKGGRTGKATNVFQNLVRCGYCGGSMVLMDKGEPPKGGKYLVCDNGRRGKKDDAGKKCKAYSVQYFEFQETVLDNLSKLRPETVLPNRSEQAEQTKLLREAIAGLVGELNDIESKIKNFMSHAGKTDNESMAKRYEKEIAEHEERQKELESEKATKETTLTELERGEKSFTKWMSDLTGLKKAITDDADIRIRLKTHLKEIISKIDVFANGHEESVEDIEATIEEHLPELERSKSYGAFSHYLEKRLLSREGRVFRLHLRHVRPSSDGLPIAPISSLAYSCSILHGEKGMKFTSPPLVRFIKEFFDGRKQGFVPKGSVSV